MDTRFYLVSAVEDSTAAAPPFVSVSLLLIQGKDGNMKKLIDFEYDLWTTEDGRCMVRVRLTREECEVDRETFRLLRAEEKRLRRERTPEKKEAIGNQAFSTSRAKQPLSLQTICSSNDEDGEFWLTDTRNFVDDVILLQLLEQFREQLTNRQLDVFEKCLLEGMSLRAYAREKGCAFSTVKGIQDEIRKKFKKFF